MRIYLFLFRGLEIWDGLDLDLDRKCSGHSYLSCGRTTIISSFHLVSQRSNPNPPNTSNTSVEFLLYLDIDGSDHIQPRVYNGPTIKVLVSSVTKDIFQAQLQISNATIWSEGSVDISSTSAPMVWALGSSPPYDPSSSSSDFQKHLDKGIFALDLKSAQDTTSSTPSTGSGTSASGTASPTTSETSTPALAAPSITRGASTDTGSG